MTKDEAINIIQAFLDESSLSKWELVQDAIDCLKEPVYVESNYKTWNKAWTKGFDSKRKPMTDEEIEYLYFKFIMGELKDLPEPSKPPTELRSKT